MASLECLCGNVLLNTLSPNEMEGHLLTSMDIDEGIPVEYGRNVWECGECGRLAFNYPSREDCSVKWYVPENKKPGRLMAHKRS